jgi:hypothetical protein
MYWEPRWLYGQYIRWNPWFRETEYVSLWCLSGRRSSPWVHLLYCPKTEHQRVIYSEAVDGVHASWVGLEVHLILLLRRQLLRLAPRISSIALGGANKGSNLGKSYFWSCLLVPSYASLTIKGYEQNVHTWLHAALALISKQAPLVTTTAVNTVQIKVNGTDPYMAMVYLHIGLLQLRFGYAALVCVEYWLSPVCLFLSAQCTENPGGCMDWGGR